MYRAKLNRRNFLKYSSGMTVGMMTSPAWGVSHIHGAQDRALSLYNLHTGERLKTTYWAEGGYQPDSLSEINHVLRDHRNNQIIDMDLSLLDLLHDLHSKFGSRQSLHIISGYRSPETNAKLRGRSSGVAKKSLHMEGKAIDIRLPGIDLTKLHQRALSLRAGGVGYYPKSDFVHIDVGRVRRWHG